MELVNNIDSYCAKQGISVKEFERKCKLANSLVHKWRLGIQYPTMRTMQKISEATGISIDKWARERGV